MFFFKRNHFFLIHSNNKLINYAKTSSYEYYIFYRKKIKIKKWNLSGVGSGSSIPGSGSADPDPDPHQNEANPKHWCYV